ncbi:hypothetical protein [Pseudomonas coronafaciens]|uniref:hypothetical protein n=1 Tax=Pseudomonas coronafaciens TaxID=53409 RepID=UPI0011C39023|nr:hypothetical protein [Pseudomonas coronafaciens]
MEIVQTLNQHWQKQLAHWKKVMKNHERLVGELAFLNDLFPKNVNRYESKWLQSSFDDNVWAFKFSRNLSFKVDFNVKLEDNSLLTDKKNQKLLLTFKNWICVQSNPAMNKGVLPDAKTAYNLTRKALHIVDYFLINTKTLQLATFGLDILTVNDVKRFFAQLSGHKKVSEAIYQWTHRVTEYFREVLNEVLDSGEAQFATEEPMTYRLIQESENIIGFTKSESIQIKIWLYKKNLYKRTTRFGFRQGMPTNRLSARILPNTLVGFKIISSMSSLNLDQYEGLAREFESAPTRTQTKTNMSERDFSKYYRCFMAVSRLARLNLGAPVTAISSLNLKELTSQFDLEATDRYRTIRPNALLPALRSAIDFVIDHGPTLFKAAISVMNAQKNNLRGVHDEAFSSELSASLGDEAVKTGIKCWSLSSHVNYNEQNFDSNMSRVFKRDEYFSRFRRNEGLWEMLRVYYGSAQLIIGLLMARRQGELIELMPFKCLDRTGRYLIFANRKSGYMSLRETIQRPIPSFAANIIKTISSFQSQLLDGGLITKYFPLFTPPNRFATGLNASLTAPTYNRSLDFFCDYFESPMHSDTQRYYFRQHQLRRGFAMMFFWGDAEGGLDTLRWFLAHTDAQHLYHYITETTPGDVLRGVKSAYVSDHLFDGNSETGGELEKALAQHFGTKKFDILETSEVETYIESLIEDGSLTVEPHFFEGDDGSDYQIVTVLRSAHEH